MSEAWIDIKMVNMFAGRIFNYSSKFWWNVTKYEIDVLTEVKISILAFYVVTSYKLGRSYKCSGEALCLNQPDDEDSVFLRNVLYTNKNTRRYYQHLQNKVHLIFVYKHRHCSWTINFGWTVVCWFLNTRNWHSNYHTSEKRVVVYLSLELLNNSSICRGIYMIFIQCLEALASLLLY